MKTAIALLLSLVAIANAFTTGPAGTAGKSIPRLSEQKAPVGARQLQRQARDKDAVVLSNALREFANWNDVWDGDYGYGGYGMYGPYRGGYRRGGYGG